MATLIKGNKAYDSTGRLQSGWSVCRSYRARERRWDMVIHYAVFARFSDAVKLLHKVAMTDLDQLDMQYWSTKPEPQNCKLIPKIKESK